MLWLILYCLVGAVVTFAYKYMAIKDRDPEVENRRRSYTYKEGTDKCVSIALWTGILWPIVAPFSFAILLADHYVKHNRKA